MFENMLIVNTALSSFNNAALYAPFFLVVGLMLMPLFFMTYVYGTDFVAKLGWNRGNFDSQINFWTALSLMLWLMLFGGNYAVIRDGISVVSVVIAVVLFVLMINVVQNSIQLHYFSKIHKKKYIMGILSVLALMAFFSSGNNWFEFLLQISAIFCGFIVGVYAKKDAKIILGNIIVLGVMTVLVLMQPEFFRFGQMGNLTPIHIFSIIFVGFCAITALTTKYVRAHGQIRRSVYIKLKWLLRIVALLAFLLFVSTESVPVFIGFILSIGLSESLTIYHRKSVPDDLYKYSFAVLLISFGILIICPLISAIGVLYLSSESKDIKYPDLLGLL